MASNSAGLSGSGRQTIELSITLVSQNESTNKSKFRVVAEYHGNGSGGWNNAAQPWKVTVPGKTWTGTYTVPSNSAGSDRTLMDEQIEIAHNSDGVLATFSGVLEVSNNNTQYIGNGSVKTVVSGIKRIPGAPSAPGKPQAKDLKSTSLTLVWTKPKDDGAKKISGYRIWWKKSTDGPSTAKQVSSGTDLEQKFSDLIPGQRYDFKVQARNGTGSEDYGDYSATAMIQMPSGIKIRSAGKYKDALLWIWVGTGTPLSDGTYLTGTWKRAALWIKSSDKWKRTG